MKTKNTTSVSDKLINERKGEWFKRINNSILIKLLHSEKDGESIYNLGKENNDNKKIM